MTFLGTRRGTQSRLWSPKDLGSSLCLWLDASDLSTIVLNGSNVSQWRDKSLNGNHLSQASAGNQPAFSSGGVTAPDNNRFLRTTSSTPILPYGTSDRSVFYVYQTLSGRSNGGQFIIQWGDFSGPGSWQAHFMQNNFGAFDPYIITQGTTFSSSILPVYNSPQITSHSMRSLAIKVNQNGFPAINATAPTNAGIPVSPLFLFRNFDNSRMFNGTIFEVLILTTGVPDSLLSIIEGYLAWKWGPTSNSMLPSLNPSHPFKFKAPKVSA